MKKLIPILTLLCISLLIAANAIASVKVTIEDKNPAAKNPTVSYRSEIESEKTVQEKPLQEIQKQTFGSIIKSDLAKFNGKSSLALLAGGLALGYGATDLDRSGHKSLVIGGGIVTVFGVFSDEDSAIMKTLFLISGIAVGYNQGKKNLHRDPSSSPAPSDGPSSPPYNMIQLQKKF
ncbi:MAG: hypothetical protein Athens071426_63 [Parcubacteria group bacterium Athens0714_26]|nr:MAG: hypothetical protein Athens101426_243 [Parcubacteria group bacterium Athens1014_26]TSD03730.1 MAG: hypothetical protein Athens071426_63 [Parcubacteria group bacterium Athens0714_26]